MNRSDRPARPVVLTARGGLSFWQAVNVMGVKLFKADCATCGVPQQAPLLVDGGKGVPRVGDLMFCWSCGSFNVLAQGGKVRKPNRAEMVEITADTDCVQLFVRWAQNNMVRARN